VDRQLSLWRWWLISFTESLGQRSCCNQCPPLRPTKKNLLHSPIPPSPPPPHSPTQAATQAIGSGRRPRARRWPRRGGRRCAAAGAKLSNHMVQARHRCEGSGGHPLSHAESAALTESCCAVRGRCGLCSPHRLRRRPHRRRRPLWTSATATGSAAGLRSFIWPALACNQ
jgi:hypothetical protein